jgi:hypothetical protein
LKNEFLDKIPLPNKMRELELNIEPILTNHDLLPEHKYD